MTDNHSTEFAQISESIQTRCPNMRKHKPYGDLLMPCPDCWSVRVTTERLPEWQPEVPWHVVTPPVTTCPHCKGMGQVYDGPGIVWKPCPMCKPLPSESGSTPATTPARCGSAEVHERHPMPCDSGCQPDWHKDWCAIYGECPGANHIARKEE